MGTKEAQRVALLAEVALLRTQAAKAEQRIGTVEMEVVALMAQAEQSSYEHELAQKVQHLSLLDLMQADNPHIPLCIIFQSLAQELPRLNHSIAEWSRYITSAPHDLEQ